MSHLCFWSGESGEGKTVENAASPHQWRGMNAVTGKMDEEAFQPSWKVQFEGVQAGGGEEVIFLRTHMKQACRTMLMLGKHTPSPTETGLSQNLRAPKNAAGPFNWDTAEGIFEMEADCFAWRELFHWASALFNCAWISMTEIRWMCFESQSQRSKTWSNHDK